MDLPIICALTEAELRRRRRTILDAIGRLTRDIDPLPVPKV